MNKIISVEAFRFFFMLQICVWHTKFREICGMTHGYLGVEFFFILSGVLLFFSYDKLRTQDPFDFIVARFKRLFPKCFLGVCFAWLVFGAKKVQSIVSIDDFFCTLLQFVSDSLMLNSCGIFKGGLNYPLWYVSVLLIGSGIVYSILYYNRRLAIGIICPLIIMLTYTYLFNGGADGNIQSWNSFYCFSLPMWRGIADLSLGTMLGYVIRYKSNFLNPKIVDCFGFISVIVVLFLTFSKAAYDQYSILASCSLVLMCFSQKSCVHIIFKHAFWNTLGGVTYEMLVLHVPLAMCFRVLSDKCHISSQCEFFLFLLCLLLMSGLIKSVFKRYI